MKDVGFCEDKLQNWRKLSENNCAKTETRMWFPGSSRRASATVVVSYSFNVQLM